MRNRITLLFLLSFFLMIFSCKKNDEEPISDISGCMDTTACNYDVTATLYDNSCTFPGCTDSLASNYNPLAGCDDSSCEFPTPYDFAQGTWFFESECEGMPSQIPLDDILPESVDIEGEGNGTLSLTILDTVTIFVIIDEVGNITVESQEILSFDTAVAGFAVTVPILVSGTGLIESEESGEMFLNYSATEPIVGFEIFNFNCEVDLKREDEDPGE